MTVPVYLFTGFLESGKTTLIKDTLSSPDFTENEKSLLICCEEGMEEYSKEELKKWKTDIVYVDSFEDITYEWFIQLNKQYKPDRILIEFNGTWDTKPFMDTEMPIGWITVQIVSCVDASTFEMYAQNMKQMIFNQLVYSDLIIFNRCSDATNKRFIRNNVKANNKNAQIIYESLDGIYQVPPGEYSYYEIIETLEEIGLKHSIQLDNLLLED